LKDELFESQVSPDGRYAGVYEDDGKTAYFYLYEMSGDDPDRVLDHIHVGSEDVGLRDSDVEVRWDSTGRKAGLFIRDELWAYFDLESGEKHGGRYIKGATPVVARPASFSN